MSSDLPAELIAEILCRLPAKRLLCFRSVSKPWRSLIDGLDFIKLHLKHSTETSSNLSLIIRNSRAYTVDFDSIGKAVELDHPLMSANNRIKVLGCCNGLLCIANLMNIMCLLNPSTKKHHMIPFLSIDLKRYYGTCVCNLCVFGFGYDPVNDDYKVVRIAQFDGRERQYFESEVKVYSVRRNAWKRVRDMPYVLRYSGANGVFVSGALHWLAGTDPESGSANLVIAFNLGDEDYAEVPQPQYTGRDFHLELGVLKGCLCLVANYRDVRSDVWIMTEYGNKESWIKLFSVAESMGRHFRSMRPLAYSKGGREVLLEQDNRHLFWYDLENKRAKNVLIRGLQREPLWFRTESYAYGTEIYVESIVPICKYRGIGERRRQQYGCEDIKDRKKREDFLSEGFKLVL